MFVILNESEQKITENKTKNVNKIVRGSSDSENANAN